MQCMQANPILLVESDGFFMFLLRFVDLAVFVHLSTSLYIIWIQNWIQWIHLDRSVPSIPSVPSVPYLIFLEVFSKLRLSEDGLQKFGARLQRGQHLCSSETSDCRVD